MRISREQKFEILIESFDVLKLNYERNARSLNKIVGEVAKLNFEKSIILWKELALRNRDKLSNPDYESGYMMGKIMGQMLAAGWREEVYRLVSEDDFLNETTYRESFGIKGCPLWAIQFLVEKNELESAEKSMKLLLANKNRQCSLFQIMDLTFPFYCSRFSNEAVEMISGWIDLIDNDEQKNFLHDRIEKIMEQ